MIDPDIIPESPITDVCKVYTYSDKLYDGAYNWLLYNVVFTIKVTTKKHGKDIYKLPAAH